MKKKRRMTRQATPHPTPPQLMTLNSQLQLPTVPRPVLRVPEVAGADEEEEDRGEEADITREVMEIEEAEVVVKVARVASAEVSKEMIDRELRDLLKISKKIPSSIMFKEDRTLNEAEDPEVIELEEEVPTEVVIEAAKAVEEEVEVAEAAIEEPSAETSQSTAMPLPSLLTRQLPLNESQYSTTTITYISCFRFLHRISLNKASI